MKEYAFAYLAIVIMWLIFVFLLVFNPTQWVPVYPGSTPTPAYVREIHDTLDSAVRRCPPGYKQLRQPCD